MAATTTSRGARRNGDDTRTDEDARDAISQSLRAGIDTATTLAAVSQRVTREFMDLSLSSAKETVRLWTEMQGSMLDALGTGPGNWSAQPAYQGWQRMLDGSTAATAR